MIKRISALLIVITTMIPCMITANAATAYVNVEEGSYLNARSAPGHGFIEAHLERGWEVEVVSVSDGWAEVVGVGECYICYVAAEYLSDEPPGDPMPYVVVSDGRVRVRAQPNGQTTRWLRPGAKVIVTGWLTVDNVRWARINNGYVMAEYLKEDLP